MTIADIFVLFDISRYPNVLPRVANHQIVDTSIDYVNVWANQKVGMFSDPSAYFDLLYSGLLWLILIFSISVCFGLF